MERKISRKMNKEKTVFERIYKYILPLLVFLFCVTGLILIIFANTVDYITINTLPHKTRYEIGEELDLKGASIRVYNRGGGTSVVYINESMIEGFDSSQLDDELKITVSYAGVMTFFYIRVTVTMYTYIFYDEDGVTILKKETALPGTVIVPPDPPTKPSDENYSYVFEGWTPYIGDNSTLYRDVAYRAVYRVINKT